jgi:hypothetical protein
VIHRIKLIVLYALAISGLIAWLTFVLRVAIMARTEERIIVYDCRMAEISPDFPPQVREDCRKLILQNNTKRSNITRT